MSDDGERVCERCGAAFDLDAVRDEFDRYNTGSSNWKYRDVITGDLCGDCADTDASDRWMAGSLAADDGPPPPPDELDRMRRDAGLLE